MAVFAAIATALLLPGFSPVTAGPAGGQVLEGTFPGTMRPGYVYLPPGFDELTRYPVVYLLHGMRGSPEEYIAATQLPVFADTEIAAGRLRPFIAVLPAAGAPIATGSGRGRGRAGSSTGSFPGSTLGCRRNRTRQGG